MGWAECAREEIHLLLPLVWPYDSAFLFLANNQVSLLKIQLFESLGKIYVTKHKCRSFLRYFFRHKTVLPKKQSRKTKIRLIQNQLEQYTIFSVIILSLCISYCIQKANYADRQLQTTDRLLTDRFFQICLKSETYLQTIFLQVLFLFLKVAKR